MITLVTINPHMAIIQIRIEKNFIEYVILDGSYVVNIILEELRKPLGLSNPKLAPYNPRMAYQTMAKI
jgi:hypothetical protein